MIHFEWLWVFSLLPLPLFARFLLKPAQANEQAALRVPFADDFAQSARHRRRFFPRRLPLWLAVLAWSFLILAAARPQWLGEFSQLPISGRDLMLAIDISGSMKEKDFAVNRKLVSRIHAAKAVASDFIKRREGDRVGLIVFGGSPYLQMPLSFDLKSVNEMLRDTFIGLAEESNTAIGDAIGLALKRLRQYDQSNRVLILLTDGVNNAGSLDPKTAAELAAQEGMKIYTIGIGSDAATARKLGFWGAGLGREFDEETLREVAKKTGGRYFRARDTAELRQIYALLDKLEVIERAPELFRTKTALYPWPLTASLLVAVLLLLLRYFSGRRFAT